jgi:catechol 2,3-dioxygenase-like lactoylglutathione lyase family enzyme
MTVRFKSPALFVRDMEASRSFYEGLLGQVVEQDHGAHLVYVGGLCLWQAERARGIIFGKSEGARGRPEFEVYFETDELEGVFERAGDSGARIIHGLREEAWGQRTFRCFDPDGHVVEVGEPMRLVIEGMVARGIALETIARTTQMPMELVLQIMGYPRWC